MTNAATPLPKPWQAPRLAELPKLTKLTLASSIGGSGGTGGGGSTVFGILLAAGLALGLGACASTRDGATDPGSVVPPVTSQVVTCTVRRDVASLTCDVPATAPGTQTIGSQGVVVALRSTGVSYNGGTDILSATVTVQNLSRQSMGTQDGVTPTSGIDVFFVAGPVGPLGETIGLNADGTATFTAVGQQYFHYPEMLAPQATTSDKVWEFQMNGTASFTFSVLVSTDLPAPDAFMTWAAEPIVGLNRWSAVSGWGSSGLGLFGDDGLVYLNDGNGWVAHQDPMLTSVFNGRMSVVVANGPKEAYRVGDNGSYIRYWDGISWRTITSIPGAPSEVNYSIASTFPGTLYAAGMNGTYRFTVGTATGGGTWTTLPDPTGTAATCRAMTAAGGLLYCGFGGGQVHIWDGVSWSDAPGSPIISPDLILAADSNDIWVYGNNLLAHYTGGGPAGWDMPSTPGVLSNSDWYVMNGTIAPDGTAYLIVNRAFPAGNQIWRWQGGTWSVDANSGPMSLWARDADTVYATGAYSRLDRRSGGSWSAVTGNFGPGAANAWKSVFVASVNDAFIGTTGGQVRHWDGHNWLPMNTATIWNVESLWGSSATDVYGADGGYTLDHFDGTSWSQVSGVPGGMGTNAVGGSGPNDVWAVGWDGTGGFGGNIAHFDGANWSAVASPNTSSNLNAVWAVNPTTAVIVGNGGVAYRWDGLAWQSDASGTGNNLYAAWGTSASDLWAVGASGTIVHWNGSAWGSGGASCDGGNNLTSIWGRSASAIYATSESGVICFYDGSTWSAISLVQASALYEISGDPTGTTAYAVGGQVYRGY